MPWKNKLYYGDNLDVLWNHVGNQTVDLIYLDPPFKSNQDYNVLFAERDGSRAAAQIKAFEDTWRWDQAAAESFQNAVERGGRVSQVMQAFRTFLGENELFHILFDGSVADEQGYVAMGGRSDDLAVHLKDAYREGMTAEDAAKVAARALAAVEERTIEAEKLEVAVLDRTRSRRKFRRLREDEIKGFVPAQSK